METDAKYFWVGLSVLIAAGLIIAAILWLSDTGGQGSKEFYIAYFRHQSLDGLQVDSNVTMKGIRVGRVKHFEISSQDIQKVKVTLEIGGTTPVREDSRAVIRRNLLTGLANIDLIGSSQQSKPLRQVLAGEMYPVIEEGKTELSAIQDSIPGLAKDVSEMVQRANMFLNDENQASFQKTLANIEKFSGTLASQDKEFAELVKDVRKIAADFRTVSNALKNFSEKAESEFGAAGEKLIAALTEITDATKNLASNLTEVVRSVKNSMNIISLEVTTLSKNVSSAAESVSLAAQKFQDPKALIAGPHSKALGPGEKGRE